jgi:hypothetical protein
MYNIIKYKRIMKRPNILTLRKAFQETYSASWRNKVSILVILLFSGIMTFAQDPLPQVFVKFSNPTYDCPTQIYCVDVEFKTDSPGEQLFGVNVRFFYDDDILEFIAIGDTAQGYGLVGGQPVPIVGPSGSGAFFGLNGPAAWINGSVQLKDVTTMTLTSTYQKYFSICFHVDDPASVGISNFCASLIWDLEENAENGGYLQGDDGVVVTIVEPFPLESGPTTEVVEQFNWQYLAGSNSVGVPFSQNCIKTKCGEDIPLSDWPIYLALGLMAVVSVFIYRRRIG